MVLSDMTRRLLFVLRVFILICPLAADGEDAAGITYLKVMPFEIKDVNPNEGALIESLLLSYITDIEGIKVYQGEEGAEEVSPDFILSGKIYSENGRRVLAVDLVDTEKAETYDNVSFYKNTNEMALNVRTIAEEYFKILSKNKSTMSEEVEEEKRPEPLNRQNILGTWQGDNGLEVMRILPGERAYAVFSSGFYMTLSYKIEGSILFLRQVSDNNFKYYHPMPERTAKILSQKAEPMRWEMQMFDGGKTMRGLKFASSIEYTEGDSYNIIKSSITKSVWLKLSY